LLSLGPALGSGAAAGMGTFSFGHLDGWLWQKF
jgi:hypothetical protein